MIGIYAVRQIIYKKIQLAVTWVTITYLYVILLFSEKWMPLWGDAVSGKG